LNYHQNAVKIQGESLDFPTKGTYNELMENMEIITPVTNEEEDLIIKATSDVFIAAMLSAPKNEPILCGIISAVLENSGQPPIKKAEVLNPFSLKEFANDRRIVLDVRVTDELDRIFNIEVQTLPHTAFIERIMFG
jgi:hypothetical protein